MTTNPDYLTDRQANALRFIAESIAELGYAPTLDELGKRFGVSKHTAFEHVKALVVRGYITKKTDKPRSIKLTEPGQAWFDSKNHGSNRYVTLAELIENHVDHGVE